MKCKCGSVIPEVRVNMGYSECVGCSSVERVGVVDAVYVFPRGFLFSL